jgi:hypothetical protein
MRAHKRSTGNAFENQALDAERAHLSWKQAWKHTGQALLERRQLRETAKAKGANGPGNLTVKESKGRVESQSETDRENPKRVKRETLGGLQQPLGPQANPLETLPPKCHKPSSVKQPELL